MIQNKLRLATSFLTCYAERMRNLVILVFMLASQLAGAYERDDGYPLKLRDVSLDYKSFLPGGSYPLITDNGLGRSQDKELQLNLSMDLLTYLYWDNVIHASTDKDTNTDASQFRLVGWQFALGARVTEWLKVGYWHHSQHLLDATLPYHFPVQDAIQIQIKVYGSGARRETLF